MPDPRWHTARNLLCVRLDTMGDVLMATPAMRALKQSAPGRRLTLLTSSAGAGIARLIPEVDEVMVYDAPWMKATAPRPDASADLDAVEALRRRNFAAAAIFTTFSQSALPAALLCYLADIPLRLAYSRENPYRLLTDCMPETEPQQHVRHEVQRQLDLVAHVGAGCDDASLSLQVPPPSLQRVQRWLHEEGLDADRPWCVVHPGATAGSRRYPPRRFAAVICRLVQELGWQVVLSGSEQERSLAACIQRRSGASPISLAGRTSLEELAALISLSPLLISNNTGPVHIAAATGTPVVDIYALTNPQHQPWQVPNRVLTHPVPCAWCYKSVCPLGHHDCMRGIEPSEIVAAAADLMRETSAKPEAARA